MSATVRHSGVSSGTPGTPGMDLSPSPGQARHSGKSSGTPGMDLSPSPGQARHSGKSSGTPGTDLSPSPGQARHSGKSSSFLRKQESSETTMTKSFLIKRG